MRKFLSIAFIGFFLSVVLWPAATAWTDIERTSIFRFTGDGTIGMHDVQTNEFFNVIYRDSRGHYDEEALATIDHIFRCHGGQEEFPISLKLIELLDYIQDHYASKEIEVISGFRSPDYNAELRHRSHRVARESLHMEGMAADIIIPGVSAHDLAVYARSLSAGGVGYYGRRAFVHVDVGPVRHW
jgi:uncharacterized protein YcbK (DUF882 family)